MRTMWLSFVDPDGEPGKKFLGVSIVDVTPEEERAALDDFPEMADKVKGPIVVAAARKAKQLGCNPGGEIQALQLESIVPEGAKNQLLDKAALLKWGFIGTEPAKEEVH